MPYSRNALNLIQLISAVIKPNGLYLADLARMIKLFRL